MRLSLSNSMGATFKTAGPCTSSPSTINSRCKKQHASSLPGLSPPKNSKQQILVIRQTSGFLPASTNHQLHQCLALTFLSHAINFKADRARCIALWVLISMSQIRLLFISSSRAAHKEWECSNCTKESELQHQSVCVNHRKSDSSLCSLFSMLSSSPPHSDSMASSTSKP